MNCYELNEPEGEAAFNEFTYDLQFRPTNQNVSFMVNKTEAVVDYDAKQHKLIVKLSHDEHCSRAVIHGVEIALKSLAKSFRRNPFRFFLEFTGCHATALMLRYVLENTDDFTHVWLVIDPDCLFKWFGTRKSAHAMFGRFRFLSIEITRRFVPPSLFPALIRGIPHLRGLSIKGCQVHTLRSFRNQIVRFGLYGISDRERFFRKYYSIQGNQPTRDWLISDAKLTNAIDRISIRRVRYCVFLDTILAFAKGRASLLPDRRFPRDINRLLVSYLNAVGPDTIRVKNDEPVIKYRAHHPAYLALEALALHHRAQQQLLTEDEVRVFECRLAYDPYERKSRKRPRQE